jgi:hypothetical protein
LSSGVEPTVSDTYTDLAAAINQACGLTSGGKVRCWDAQGVEDVSSSHTAAQLSTTGVPAVQLATDAAGRSLCALFNHGRVLCAQDFLLGVSSTFRLPEGESLVEIAVGLNHVCGIRADDTVLCVDFPCTASDCTADLAPPQGFKAALH